MKFLSAALCVLLAFSLNAQRNIFDGFDNNDNGWPESITDANMVYVKDGRYTIESKNDGYFRHSFNVKGGFEKHFRIEVSMRRDSGVSVDNGVGIVWGRADNDSTYMAFLVYGDGSFVFENKVKGKLNVVSPNSFNYAYSGDDLNGIRVERNIETDQYDFSINDQLVLSVPYVAPLSDEAGIHVDLAGTYFLDYFWFIEQANTATSYVPASLAMSEECGQSALKYTSDYGYSYCVPFGWRVDEYKETHQTVWPAGFPYVVNTDYTRLAIEDSFSTAARNDFKIYSDSLHVREANGTTFTKVPSQPGVEVYAATYRYVSMEGNGTTTYRYYIYHKQSGGFMLVETIIPLWEEQLSLDFNAAAYGIAATIQWK
jgi:hypothetical protein